MRNKFLKRLLFASPIFLAGLIILSPLLVTVTISPTETSQKNAKEENSVAAETNISINVTKQKEIDFSNLIDLDSARSANVNVTTNNRTGYTLYADATGEHSLGVVRGDLLQDHGPLNNATTLLSGSARAIKNDSTLMYVENDAALQNNRKKAVNMKLTAIANPNSYSYKLTYDTANSRNIEANKISNMPNNMNDTHYEERSIIFIISKNIPTSLGYNFIGWSTSPNGQVQYQPGDKVIIHYDDPIVHLYPIWEPANFNVSVNKGSHIDLTTGSGYHTYLSDVAITATSAEGYHFDHWETQNTSVKFALDTAASTTFKMPPENVSVTAIAGENDYNIRYHTNGGKINGAEEDEENPETEPIKYTGKVTLKDGKNLSRYGYHFVGWSIGVTGPDSANPDYQPATEYNMSGLVKRAGIGDINNGTVNLYAVWRPYWNYQIVYDVNGGYPETAPLPQAADDVVLNRYTFEVTDIIPLRENHETGPYMFIGWASQPNAEVAEYSAFGENNQVTLLGTPGEPEAVKTLYAVWRKVFNYKLDYDPGTDDPVSGLPNPQTISSVGDGVFLLGGEPSRRGYVFQGYSDDGGETLYPAKSRYVVPKTEVGTDPIEKTLTAIWKPDYYDVSIEGEHFSTDANVISIAYDGSGEITVTPDEGYYVTGITCPDGYTCSNPETGENNSAAHEAQTITITNDLTIDPGTLTIMTSNTYTVPVDVTKLTADVSELVFTYGETKEVTLAKDYWYYIDSVECPTGYICSGYGTGSDYHDTKQTITITNDPDSYPNGGHLKINGEDYVAEMQSFSCDTLPAGVTKNVIDTRNDKKYTVARLKDNKCWMTSNLNIVGPMTLTSANSNVTSDYALPASSTSSWCKVDYSAACYNTSAVLYSGSEVYGAYYSWRAATAGSGTYGLIGTAPASVCPKNWRLPTNAEQVTMYNNYGSLRGIMANGPGEPAYVLSGESSGGTMLSRGSYGFYWSSTGGNVAYYAYYILLDSPNNRVNPRLPYERYYGRTLRCIANN